jgi:beta-mannanase
LPLPAARDAQGLGRVAAGDYDAYLDAWGRDAAAHGAPLLVRFAHEMNDAYRYPWGPQHNTKEEFIAAWRHVVARVRAAGATNVLWVWSPHVAYEYWDLWYPGDDVVDWVATGVLNYGPIAQWSQWWSVAQIFGTRYAQLEAFGKPIMMAEFGSLAVGGDRAAWYQEALLDLPSRYPAVRAVVFFHDAADQTVTYQQVDWSIVPDSSTRAAVVAALRQLAK